MWPRPIWKSCAVHIVDYKPADYVASDSACNSADIYVEWFAIHDSIYLAEAGRSSPERK
jgi:hypothetical protein